MRYQSIVRLPILAFAVRCALLIIVLIASGSRGQTIDLSLNVFYSDPSNSNSGGNWELVAKSSHFGISGLNVRLTNIATSQNRGARATVNGSDPAGMSVYVDVNTQSYRELTMGQVALFPLPAGHEETLFYGIGALANGAPNYPGKPAGTNSVGPVFTSLTNPQDIPWATGDTFGDPTWSTAARVAGGTFNPGATPNFFPGSSGNVFATLGTSTALGVSIQATTFSTGVRTNLAVPEPASFTLIAQTFVALITRRQRYQICTSTFK
jgi:hypothetical protein